MNDTRVTKTRAIGLSKHATVFQAEIQAIRLGCSLLKDNIPIGSEVVFMVDSQAAILALQNVDTSSQLVKQAKDALNKVGNDYTISIQWIKAHVNNKGNEIADQVAKTGSRLIPHTEIKCGKAYVKKLVSDEMYTEWDRRWQTLGTCRQAFFFYKYVDRSKSKKIMKLNRHELGILIRYTTGHAHLRRHNKVTGTMLPRALTRPEPRYRLMDPDELEGEACDDDDEDIRCRLCKIKGTHETPIHIIKNCLAVWHQRRDQFGSYTFERDDEIGWEPAALVRFYRDIDLENQPN